MTSRLCLFVLLSCLSCSLIRAQSVKLIKDINPGGGWGAIWDSRMVRFGNSIYFVGNDGVNGSELWKSDGTVNGTVMVKDINPGKKDSRPSRFIVTNTQLFFVANDGVHGMELWRTDGTAIGTWLVKELTPGNNEESTISYEYYGAVGSTIIFGFVQNFKHRYWRSDGSAAGTTPLKDLEPGSGLRSVINYKGLLYFAANDGVHGVEFWQTDGSIDGTSMTHELTGGKSGSLLSDFTLFQDKLYFFADTTYQNNPPGKLHGAALWQSDGTAGGSKQVINPMQGIKQVYGLQNLTAAGDRLYFYIYKQAATPSMELWRSSGTAAGTLLVKPISTAGGIYLAPMGNNVYFTATDPINGVQVWKSDGTAVGTGVLKLIGSGKTSLGFGFGLGVLKSTLFFSADDGVHGIELWQTDGTSRGTKLTQDIDPNNQPKPNSTPTSQPTNGVIKLTRRPVNSPFPLLSTDGLYFIADDGVHGRELFRIPYDSMP